VHGLRRASGCLVWWSRAKSRTANRLPSHCLLRVMQPITHRKSFEAENLPGRQMAKRPLSPSQLTEAMASWASRVFDALAEGRECPHEFFVAYGGPRHALSISEGPLSVETVSVGSATKGVQTGAFSPLAAAQLCDVKFGEYGIRRSQPVRCSTIPRYYENWPPSRSVFGSRGPLSRLRSGPDIESPSDLQALGYVSRSGVVF